MTKALVLDDNRPIIDKLEEFLRVLDVKIGLEKVLLLGLQRSKNDGKVAMSI